MATKEAQINLRLPAELDAWLESHAGGKRGKPALVRRILERECAREAEERMLKMFNSAWDSLSPEDREEIQQEREDHLAAYAGGSRA
jgi:Arc/MetJ-type ribon-helix-helix transcriptional regulator